MERHSIYEKSSSIPISQISHTLTNKFSKEYSLKRAVFDPSKSSPPNEFMIKLQMRNHLYNSFRIIEDNITNE